MRRLTALGPLVVIFLIICSYNGTCGYTYITTERPFITTFNKSIISFANISSVRYGRGDPKYYVNIDTTFLIPLDNRVLLHFSFYEFLSNEYRPSFVEMDFTWCRLVEKDNFFGRSLRQGVFKKPCPHPPGHYNLQNLTIPVTSIPAGFPFRKGRIHANLTLSDNSFIAHGYIDMEFKAVRRNSKSKMVPHLKHLI